MGGEIPTKILKECEFTFEILTQCINKSFTSGEFSDCLKQANVSPIFKKDDPLAKENYSLLVFFLYFRKCMKNYFINDCLIMLKIFYSFAALEKRIARNTHYSSYCSRGIRN